VDAVLKLLDEKKIHIFHFLSDYVGQSTRNSIKIHYGSQFSPTSIIPPFPNAQLLAKEMFVTLILICGS
jgi:hypothetical protein